MMRPAPAEFARPVDIARLAPGETVFDIAATPTECAALARRFALLGIDRLAARVGIERIEGGLVRVIAEFSAAVVQECVVTLEPVASTLSEQVTLLFSEAGDAPEALVLSAEAEPIEPISGGIIDIGEAVAQQLSLALDPYPRAPGAAAALPDAIAENKGSAFAALAKWKERG